MLKYKSVGHMHWLTYKDMIDHCNYTQLKQGEIIAWKKN